MLVQMILPFAAYSQECIEFSGQTVAFTLSAGAKAAWDKDATGLKNRCQSEKRISFWVDQSLSGKVRFKFTGQRIAGNLSISLYTLDGRWIGAAAMQSRTSGAFSRVLLPGIYVARCEAGGTVIQTVRFVVRRQT